MYKMKFKTPYYLIDEKDLLVNLKKIKYIKEKTYPLKNKPS